MDKIAIIGLGYVGLPLAHDEYKQLNSKLSTFNSQLLTYDIKSILDDSDGRL